MKKEEIHLGDIKRILFGQAPPLFLLEAFIRTMLIYLILLMIVRWLGKRMSGQLTIMEMAVMLALGAIVAVAMQIPDRGILLSVTVLLCTVSFQRGFGWLGFNNAKVEKLIQGDLSVLVKDGVLQIAEMKRCRISQQQLFAQVRGKGYYHLGKIRRVYLEASGLFSIFPAKTPKAGLSILPPDERELFQAVPQTQFEACGNCGFVQVKTDDHTPCTDCHCDQWEQAIL
jgi:uncharacterized membrane protein YcaP (DUF421 family)